MQGHTDKLHDCFLQGLFEVAIALGLSVGFAVGGLHYQVLKTAQCLDIDVKINVFVIVWRL